MKAVYKVRITNNQLLYLTDENNEYVHGIGVINRDRCFIYNLVSKERTYLTSIIEKVEGKPNDAKISEIVGMSNEDEYNQFIYNSKQLLAENGIDFNLNHTNLYYDTNTEDECSEISDTYFCNGYTYIPILNTYAIPYGEEAHGNFSIDVDSDNMVKTYTLELGIPKGKDGKEGEKGENGRDMIMEIEMGGNSSSYHKSYNYNGDLYFSPLYTMNSESNPYNIVINSAGKNVYDNIDLTIDYPMNINDKFYSNGDTYFNESLIIDSSTSVDFSSGLTVSGLTINEFVSGGILDMRYTKSRKNYSHKSFTEGDNGENFCIGVVNSDSSTENDYKEVPFKTSLNVQYDNITIEGETNFILNYDKYIKISNVNEFLSLIMDKLPPYSNDLEEGTLYLSDNYIKIK